MQKLIKDIAIIQAGYSFREKIEPYENGEFRVLQIKDVGLNGNLLTYDLLQTQVDELRPEYLVQKGDVLFTTKGSNRRACIISEDLPNTIFVGQLFALREIVATVEPVYLAWYINQKPAQEFLEANASGSYIQNIRKEVLANLPIIIPPMEVQKKIVEIHKLALCEKDLVEQIQMKRSQIIERVLLNAVNNGEIKL